jgi:hypothetical protein
MMHDETPLASFTVAKTQSPKPSRPHMAALREHALADVEAAPTPNEQAFGAPGRAGYRPREAERAQPHEHSRLDDEEVFHIRLADSASHQEATGLLIRKMYGWRGYAVEPDGAAPASRLTLFAECRGAVVGTMGLCLDGALGLPADENFREQLDVLRDQGRHLCEPSRLAIDAGVTKRVFASMIHVSYLYAHVLNGYSDYVIEVNPRHVAFYQRMLGFERVGPVRQCSRVGAPAVLLRVPLCHMAEQIHACGGRPDLQTDERSFYPFFFAPGEEAAIARRLLANRR